MKTEKPKTKTEPEAKTPTAPKDLEWFTLRVANTQDAINNMDEGRPRTQMQFALDDVLDASIDDKKRYTYYTQLKALDDRYNIDSIKTIRTTDPNTTAYHAIAEMASMALLEGQGDYTQFAAVRRTAKNPNATLTEEALLAFLAGRYEDNSPYDKKTDYITTLKTLTTVEETTEEATL